MNIADLSPHALGLALLAASDDQFADTPRRIDLSNLRDVRLELAHVYREMNAGRLESQDATRAAYVLRQIHDVIVTSELEKRLEELEQRQALPGQYPNTRGTLPLN